MHKLLEFNKKELKLKTTDWLSLCNYRTCDHSPSFKLKKCTLILSFLFFCILGCENKRVVQRDDLIILKGTAIGTTWMVQAFSPDNIQVDELRNDILKKLDETDKIFSSSRPNSALHLFNKSLSNSIVSIDPKLHELLEHAKWMHDQSLGAFDPTIAPLVNLWTFESGRAGPTIPNDEKIIAGLSLVGFEKLKLFSKGKAQKMNPDLQVDLSGSAKGEIVDQLCLLLSRWGLKNYLIEIGGKIRAQGRGKDGKGWIVELEDEATINKLMLESVSLRNYSLASSGTTRIEHSNTDLKKKSDLLLDPRTGRPVSNNLVAVHAFSPMARDADAWATALMILGVEEGVRMAEKMDLVARFCVKDGNKITQIYSQAFQRIYFQ